MATTNNFMVLSNEVSMLHSTDGISCAVVQY